jgi:hypothetical protein
VTGVRKGKKPLGPDATKELSQRLRNTIEEEERRGGGGWPISYLYIYFLFRDHIYIIHIMISKS